MSAAEREVRLFVGCSIDLSGEQRSTVDFGGVQELPWMN